MAAKRVLEYLEIGLIRKLGACLEVQGGPLKEITVADFSGPQDLLNAMTAHAEKAPIMPCGLLSIPSEQFNNSPNPAGLIQRITTVMSYRFAAMSATSAGLHDRKVFAYWVRDVFLAAIAQMQFQPEEWPDGWTFDYIRPTDSSIIVVPEWIAWTCGIEVKIRGTCTEVD